jgi:hypothetical protein
VQSSAVKTRAITPLQEVKVQDLGFRILMLAPSSVWLCACAGDGGRGWREIIHWDQVAAECTIKHRAELSAEEDEVRKMSVAARRKLLAVKEICRLLFTMAFPP